MLTKALRPDFDTLLAAGRPGSREGEMTDPDVEVKHVRLVRPLRPRHDLLAANAIRGLIRHWEPQIIHTHQAKAGAVTRLVNGNRAGRPITIHTFHGHVLEGYFGSVARSIFLAAERKLARRTDALIAVSNEIRDELLELGIGAEDRWWVIPLGFDLEPFLQINGTSSDLRKELGLAPDIPLVGVIGRLAPIKDHSLLLEAIARCPGVHLAIFGDGELRDELRRRASEAGMSERVHFMGWWVDIAAAISGLDVVALTSRNEGTPVSLIEASAAGRPVVATDVGGVRSVVREGVTGYIVPPRSSEAVADALRSLLADPSRRAEMGAAGRDFVSARFTQERLVADVRALYTALLGSA